MFVIFRMDSFTSIKAKIWIMEFENRDEISRYKENIAQVFENLPDNASVKQQYHLYSTGVFDSMQEAEKEYNVQKDILDRHNKIIAELEWRTKPSVKKMPITATFPDGREKDYPNKVAFLVDNGVPASYSGRVPGDYIRNRMPLKSRKYPQLNGVILKFQEQETEEGFVLPKETTS